eukprot:7931148-Alexandrium_andersonii.AAC.1
MHWPRLLSLFVLAQCRAHILSDVSLCVRANHGQKWERIFSQAAVLVNQRAHACEHACVRDR